MSRRWLSRAMGLLLSVATACSVREVQLEGKFCTPSGECSDGLSCNPYTIRCERSEPHACPAHPPELLRCNGPTKELYLSPTGSDTNLGTSADAPRRTLDGLDLLPGTVVRLAPGQYGTSVDLPPGGQQDCPLVLAGPTGGAPAIIQALYLVQSHWRIQDLTLDPSPSDIYALVVDRAVRDIVVQRVLFHRTDLGPDVHTGSADVFLINDGCVGCTFVSNTFRSGTRIMIVGAASRDLVLRGNTFDATWQPLGFDGQNILIEGNVFTGSFDGPAIIADQGATVQVVRNVFHDLTVGEPLIRGATDVVSNTFVRVSGAGASAADGGRFSNNLLQHIVAGVSGPRPAESDYNLFDDVDEPYESGGLAPHDRVGASNLDGQFVPAANSAALDTGDPAIPAPPSFDAPDAPLVDIGARERGAALLPDQRYCVQEPWANR